jgi:hypothetical protein
MQLESEKLFKQNEVRLGQVLEAINRLANIAPAHGQRLDGHQERLDDLDGRT